ncbi:MAG: hypothetical protein U5P10_05690 [Spirochaetia bacterium]|nr:hypothetical protein [Spirochaetia bacterium]
MNRLYRIYRYTGKILIPPAALGLVLFFSLTAFAAANPSANPSADSGVEWKGRHLEPPEHFKLRNSVAAEQLQELGSTPQEHSKDFIQWEHQDGQRAWFYTDYHAAYPLPVESFIQVLKDAENEDKVFPNMTYTSDISPDPDPDEPAYQEVKISFKIFGIGADYHYLVYRIPTWYPDGSFSVHWALVDSVDNKYADLYGSWYVKEFEKEGQKHTYVRNYVETEMIGPPPLLKTIRNLFAERTVRKFFESLYEAAEEQQRS